MSKTPLAKRRKELESRLETLTRRTDRVEQDLLRRADGPLPQDSEEQAQRLENDEVLLALDRAGVTELGEIRAALARMDAGSYGKCSSCGGVIEEARLDALPHAVTCARCAGAKK